MFLVTKKQSRASHKKYGPIAKGKGMGTSCVVRDQQASLVVTKHLNWGRSDPVYIHPARKPDLAFRVSSEATILLVRSVFVFFFFLSLSLSVSLWRHRGCKHLEMNTVQTAY